MTATARPAIDPPVLASVQQQDVQPLATSGVAVAEISAGLACLPDGARRRDLASRWQRLLAQGFGSRVLPLDHRAAVACGGLFARRQHAGRRL